MNLECKPQWACKQLWLDVAEVIDSLRVFPRLIVLGYGWWAIKTTTWVIKWYEALPSDDRTVTVTAMVSVILPGIYGLSAIVYQIYSSGGRNWTPGDK